MNKPDQLSEALALLRKFQDFLLPMPMRTKYQAEARTDLCKRTKDFLSRAQERPADESEREDIPGVVMRAAERLATPLDPSRVGPGMATTNQVDIDCAQLILAYLRGRQSAPCPHLRSSDEGTQYCALAQSGAQGEPQLFAAISHKERFESAERERDELRAKLESYKLAAVIFVKGKGTGDFPCPVWTGDLPPPGTHLYYIDAALQQSAERGEKHG